MMATGEILSTGFPSQARLFLRLRYRLFRNGLSVLLSRARLRLSLIVFLTVLIWGSLFILSWMGFHYVRTQLATAPPFRDWLIELLGNWLFLAFTVLMVFSTGLLLYGSLFRAAETGYLLTAPVDPDHIFAYKLQEAITFSGWAFFLLGTPLLVAFGIEMAAEWLFLLLFVPFLLAFLLLTGAVGGLLCLVIVYFLPHRKKQFLLALVLVALVGGAWAAISLIRDMQPDSISEGVLRRLLDYLKLAQIPFLPSRWITRGLMASARGQAGDSVLHLAILWSNALFLYLLAAWTARRVYRRAYNRVASMGGARRRYGQSWSDRLVAAALRWADYRTRLFVIKDLRTFRRDPVQWVQVLILGGALFLYFINLRWLPHSHYRFHERSLIGLLNITVIGLMLATYTSRFIFPMMSLEGRNFWILGLLPLERDRLLLGKFAYAATLTVGTSGLLALLSEVMLQLDWAMAAIHLAAIVVLALGLSAISVGLGAYLVNLKETNPSKIATGFGGTINLLVSLLFTVTTLLLAGVPTLLYFTDAALRENEEVMPERVRLWLWIGMACLLPVGAATVLIPLRLGIKAFRRMEF
jgi:ABC-2 type transport system permease protein